MHFFTEPTKLNLQTALQVYGPVSGAEANRYQTSSIHKINISASTDNTFARVYSCQDSLMIVQPSIDSTLVNLILKPIVGTNIKTSPVKYYIYRGIDINCFVASSSVVASNDVMVRTEFIKNLYTNWATYISVAGITNNPSPNPKIFGYDPTASETTLVEELFNSAASNNNSINDYQAIKVSEGEWIGNVFNTKEISFEIITETDHFEYIKIPGALTPDPLDIRLDLSYVRKTVSVVDVTGLPVTNDAERFIVKTKREKILNYIDPVAFFGMHYKGGVYVTTYVPTSGDSLAGKSKVLKKTTALYTEVLSKFLYPNRVYVDIRSEKGYSYNFYGNYAEADTSHIVLKSTRNTTTIPANAVTQDLAYGDWPILLLQNFTGNTVNSKSNGAELQFRVDDNVKPLLFSKNPLAFGEKNTNNFVNENALFVTGNTDWTKKVKIWFANYNPTGAATAAKLDVACHIKLQYFRQEHNSTHLSVLKTTGHLDMAFGGIPVPEIDIQTALKHYTYTRLNFVKGSNFSYVGENGIYQDATRVLFYADNAYSLVKSNNSYSKIDVAEAEYNPIIESPSLRKTTVYNKWNVTSSTTTDGNFDILEIVGYNRTARKVTSLEDILMLGITKTELATLSSLDDGNAPFFSDKHRKYITFTEVPGQTDMVTATPFRKFTLGVQGMNTDGKHKQVTSAIAVFGTGINMFCSKGFTSEITFDNFLPDPGVFTEFDLVATVDYDKSHAIVTGHPTLSSGYVSIADKFNDSFIPTIKAELKGRLFYPKDPGSGSNITLSIREASYPLIVIMHGNGQYYHEYDEVGTFLAKNGFIVASISCLIDKGEIKLIPIHAANLAAMTPFTHVFNIDDGSYLYKDNGTTDQIHKINSITSSSIPGQPPLVSHSPFTDWVKNDHYKKGTNKLVFSSRVFPGGNYMAILGRTYMLYNHLKLIKHHFTTRVQNKIGLLGHSRGGEAAVMAAQNITNVLAPATLYKIEAILALTPSDLWEEKSLTKNIPYFSIYGSRDGDITGAQQKRMHFPRSMAGSSGFGHYDRASNTTEKSMVFVIGGTHNGFVNGHVDYLAQYDHPNVVEDVAVQKKILLAYGNGFFRTYIKQESIWKPIFQGSHTPPSAKPTKGLLVQYRNMVSATGMIGSFDGTNPNVSTTGTGITAEITQFNPRIAQVPASRKDPYSPHYQNGLFVIYGTGGGTVAIAIPATKKNVSGFQYLSFRIAHVAGKYQNTTTWDIELFPTYNDLSKLNVQLVSGTSTPVTSDHVLNRKLPEPDQRMDYTYPISGNVDWRDKKSYTKSAMITIRIPLTAYTTAILTEVTKINFVIPAVNTDGRLVIDDIEFTN